MDDISGIVSAAAIMAIFARRKKPTESQQEAPAKELPTQTTTISEAEREEMERAPRAYRRRKMKELGKLISAERLKLR